MEFVPDWSGGLPPELLELIAKRLPLMEDFTAFRGVCATWRSSVTKNKVPLMMLPGRVIYTTSTKKGKHEREFYSLSKSKICARLHLLDAKGKECFDVGFGWILCVSAGAIFGKTSYYGEACLVKPFHSCPKIELPSPDKFPVDDNKRGTSGILRHALLLGTWFITRDVSIWGWDPNSNEHTKVQVILNDISKEVVLCMNNTTSTLHLGESSDGELLVILLDIFLGGAPYDFIVMRVDLENRTTKRIKSVGKDAIFVGSHSTTVAVAAADYPGVLKPNCIYFTDNCFMDYPRWEKGKTAGIYNLEDGSKENFDIEAFSQPMWIFLSF